MFQLATMGRINHFHIFLSLAVNCENKLLKLYCVPRLFAKIYFTKIPSSAQALDSLILTIDTLNYKTKLQRARFTLLEMVGSSSHYPKVFSFPSTWKNVPHQIFIPPLNNNFHVITQ